MALNSEFVNVYILGFINNSAWRRNKHTAMLMNLLLSSVIEIRPVI